MRPSAVVIENVAVEVSTSIVTNPFESARRREHAVAHDHLRHVERLDAHGAPAVTGHVDDAREHHGAQAARAGSSGRSRRASPRRARRCAPCTGCVTSRGAPGAAYAPDIHRLVVVPLDVDVVQPCRPLDHVAKHRRGVRRGQLPEHPLAAELAKHLPVGVGRGIGVDGDRHEPAAHTRRGVHRDGALVRQVVAERAHCPLREALGDLTCLARSGAAPRRTPRRPSTRRSSRAPRCG